MPTPPHPTRLLRIVIDELITHHPTPWRMDHDWAVDILDANGTRVMCVQTVNEARALIDVAHDVAEERQRRHEEVEKLIAGVA